MKNSFFIKSLGCKTNQIEGKIIFGELIENGFIEAKSPEASEIYILNSCSVTEHADKQALYLIKQVKLKNPSIIVVLTGCFAQTSKNPEISGADLILGNNEKLDFIKNLKEFLEEYEKNGTTVKQKRVEDIFNVKKFKEKDVKFLKTTRPTIKIQEGCNNRCSYCIIPFARGVSRSLDKENILRQINNFAKNGYREIVLTGIHIGQWGLEWGETLLDLLKEIEATKILRYRLGSLYVTEITDEMIEFLSKSEKFCPHFHLSLQSLCNKTLQNMDRHYTKEFALETIEKLHKNFHLPFLGCDVITGFPMETEEDFEETYNALKSAKLSFIHSFPYSIRKGTKAAEMKGQVLEHIKKERTKRLIKLSEGLHKEFLQKNANLKAEVLFQKKNETNGKFLGITRNYIKIYKESSSDLWNTVQTLDLSEFELE